MGSKVRRIKNVPTFDIDNLIKSHFNYCPDMKQLLGICAIFLMASFQLVAQDAVAPVAAPASKAVLTLESDVVDYGTIDHARRIFCN